MNVQSAGIAGRSSAYKQILDEAWEQHLAPRAPDAPTVISLFAGCGGSSLGYSMAGYKELLAVEWDRHAVETFQQNFNDVPVYADDIASLSVEACLQRTGLAPGMLDVLDGSPPCQGFSTAGRRILDDPRNSLFREYIRLLQGLQPKACVMENVSGIVKGSHKLIFAEILRALKQSGYHVLARMLNAAYFAVPQTRERLIILGIRQDLSLPASFPRAQYGCFTLRDAWSDALPPCEPGLFYPLWLKQAVKEIRRRETTGNRTKAAAFKKYKGTKGSAMGFVRLRWDQPATTLCKSFISCAWLGHPDDERFINESEMKRIASFPDAFRLIGTFKQKVAVIGNAVPPLFMRAIAQHVRSLLEAA